MLEILVNYEDLKKTLDRASNVTLKKNDFLKNIMIKADEKNITVTACTGEQWIKIELNGEIIKPGFAAISIEEIKKMPKTISGDAKIYVEDDFKLHIKTAKKKLSVQNNALYDEDLIPSIPTMKDETLFLEMNMGNFVEILKNLNCFLAKSDYKRLLTGYNFDGNKNRIAAIDGHRIGIKKMSSFKSDNNVIVPGLIYSQLKNVADKKDDIKIYTDDKMIMFSGKDFTIYSRLIEGDYFKLEGIINFNKELEFELDVNEFKAFAKEYKSLKADKKPMFLAYDSDENTFYSGIATATYETYDVFEKAEMKKNNGSKHFIYGLNPEFVYDALELYEDKILCFGTNVQGNSSMKTPIIFEDDEYITLILPINFGTVDIKEFILSKMAA